MCPSPDASPLRRFTGGYAAQVDWGRVVEPEVGVTTNMSGKRIAQSTQQVLWSLRAVVKASYNLAPAAVVVMVLVAALVVVVTVWSTPLMMTVVLFIVLSIAILLYISTWNYGEAALALAAGLLTVYSVTWTPRRFIAFIAVWLTFSSVALLASSIKVAADVEAIFLAAAGALAGHSDAAAIKAAERRLRRVADAYKGFLIGGKDKAEVISVLAFRRIDERLFPAALSAVDTLSTALQLEPVAIANLVCDITRAFETAEAVDVTGSLQAFISTLQETAVPPPDFIKGFQSSRYLLLSRRLSPETYFAALQESLESGVAPDRVGEYLEGRDREV
ncbi:MAG TPA: hypothetical protein VNJ70_09800 [Thermoanaerobaculia bacterium]|nr:hypothetical protein [Thermoanaerobaculia bacterium]